MGKREGKLEREKEGERKEGNFRERGSNFSLNFSAIGPSVYGEVRSKVSPHGRAMRGYQFCGVSTTPRGRGLLLLGLFFGLRALLMVWVVEGREWPFGLSQNLGPKCWKLGTVLGSPKTYLRTFIGPYALFVCKLWFWVLLGRKWP